MISSLMQNRMCFTLLLTRTLTLNACSYQSVIAYPHHLQLGSAEKGPETKICTVLGNQKPAEETEQNFVCMCDTYSYT